MDLQGKKVAFLGDSITESVGASAYEHCYVARFQAAHPECTVYNFGISGTRIADQKEKLVYHDDYHYITRLDKMNEDYDLIFVFGGTNDYGHGTAALGKFGDQTDDTFYGALYNLSYQLLKKFTKAKIVYMTPLHRSDMTCEVTRPDGEWTLEDYVAAIKETAAYFALPVLDLREISGIQPAIPFIKERLMPDGLHPNDEGYKRLFEIIDGYVRGL